MIDILRLSIFNTNGTCTLDSYINCELYRMEYRIDNAIDKNIIQLNRDKLRERLDTPRIRSVPMVRDKLKAHWIIKDWKEIEPTERAKNMVVVYKEQWRTAKHAACVIWEADFHWILTWGNWRVYLSKKWKYKFYQYIK